jgi:hypothetical protein
VFFNLTDVRFGLQRVEKKGEEYTVFRGRTRVPGTDQDFGPLYLAIDESHSLASIDRRPNVLELFGEKEREVLTSVRSLATFTAREAKQVTKGNVCDKTIRRAFRHACEHGLIAKTEHGVYAWTGPQQTEVSPREGGNGSFFTKPLKKTVN